MVAAPERVVQGALHGIPITVDRMREPDPDQGHRQRAELRVSSYTTSTWTFVTPTDRAWWGQLWAERVLSSGFAGQAIAYGLTDDGDLAGIVDAWRTWAAELDCLFVVTHGELIART